MKKFWCNGKKDFCEKCAPYCGDCIYWDFTGGEYRDVYIPTKDDQICALRDQVHNLTLYLKEAFALCPDDLEVLNDWHPGLPGYAPEPPEEEPK